MSDIQEEAYSEAMDEIRTRDAEIDRMKTLLTRAADVIEHGDWTGNDYEERWKNSELIAETAKGGPAMKTAQEILELVEKIKPLLAHNDPQVQSAVLAELLSIWLVGFHISDDREATEQLRAELLARHCELVRELTAVNAKMLLRQAAVQDCVDKSGPYSNPID